MGRGGDRARREGPGQDLGHNQWKATNGVLAKKYVIRFIVLKITGEAGGSGTS